ncbi:MAG: hypothetical protein BMS9Abin37_1707 [Acidobacteriota bacterium]|nr:MAG: hypothetical protein BMS9Abin37_1707 [Acidobacteriota bacterium]
MRKIIVFVVAVVLLPLASTSILADGPELNLKAPRATFMKPTMPNERRRQTVTIRISARLENLDEAEDLEEYYCLDQVWDWGDDTDSEYSPDCDPYEEGMDIETRFSGTHQYRYPGNYTVWLRLQSNGDTVIAGDAKVQIRGG